MVRFETSLGGFTLELHSEKAPTSVANFLAYVDEGFFDGLIFHRVIPGFMVQGGDPTGTGRGGPGYRFEDEPVNRKYDKGTLAMANAGPNTNGSQFFIMHSDYPLPPNYVIFAKVVKGLETVDAIAAVPTTLGPDGNMSSPTTPVVMKKVTVKP